MVLVAVAGIVVIGTRVLPQLFHSARDTEEYQVAYAYLKGSEAFQMLGEEESAIHMQSYQRKVALKKRLHRHDYLLYCRAENSSWSAMVQRTPLGRFVQNVRYLTEVYSGASVESNARDFV